MQRPLCIVALAALLPVVLPSNARAQAFQPTRPLEIVVHNAPGGGSDVLARFVSVLLEREKLIPVRNQVHNRTGGGGATAMAYIAEKRGDPHTLALFTSAWVITPMLAEEAKVQMWEMTPIARLVLESALILVKSDAPYRSLNDFIEAAKKEPGKLRQAGGSLQTRGNFVRLLLQKATGAQWSYISFPGGGERVTALLGGHMQLLVAEPQEIGEYVRRGSLRPLAQIATKRLPSYAEVPTIQEAGFNVKSDPTMRGVVAPPGISREAATYWESVFARMVKSPEWRKYLDDNQFEDGFLRGEDTLKSARDFAEQIRGMLRETGLKVYR
jgi:putative tricarboxylic transport membrane protein